MNMMRKAIRSVGRAPGAAALVRYVMAAALFPGLAAAAERRCGWLENPTPGNFSLRDPQGEWVMGEQGGYQADGMDETPDFTSRGWVGTNGNYGYGSACLVGTFDRRKRQVVRIVAAEPVPLARCKADRKLPAP